MVSLPWFKVRLEFFVDFETFLYKSLELDDDDLGSWPFRSEA